MRSSGFFRNRGKTTRTRLHLIFPPPFQGPHVKRAPWIAAPVAVVNLLLLGTSFVGCHRGYYRRQADAEVQAVIRQKTDDPRWNLPDVSIDIRRESRMYNPFSADHPPMPPDDPSSHRYMESVDGKRGYPHWHANGDTQYVESPDWMAFLPMNEDGLVVINNERAVTLALTHAPFYQRQREELYLSALDVTLERFAFDTQGRPDWGLNSDSTVTRGATDIGLGSSFGLTRTFATGTQWLVAVANDLSWSLGGGSSPQFGGTTLSFALTQPLMLFGGRDWVLESLTQAERSLLANIRLFEQFRGLYYLQITTGRNANLNLSAAGLAIGQPLVGSTNAGGLLGLLQQQQSIRIQEFNVASLRNVLDQFIELRRAERLDTLQLTQAETALYSAQQGLLTSRTDYQTRLDEFKRQLGLPPTLPIAIEDDFLRAFELIDDTSNARRDEIALAKLETGNSLIGIADFIEANRQEIQQPPEGVQPADQDPAGAQGQIPLDAFSLAWTDELRDHLTQLKPLVESLVPLVDRIALDDVQRVAQDIQHYEQVRPRRVAALQELQVLLQNPKEVQYDIEPGIVQESSLAPPETLQEQLSISQQKLEGYRRAASDAQTLLDFLITQGSTLTPTELYQRVENDLIIPIPQLLTDLASVSLEISLVQAVARADSIELPEVDMDPMDAIEIARCFRRDWMNARAALVDSWRRIEVRADELEALLDLELTGSMGPDFDTSNPFKLNYETGTLRGGIRFVSPLTRLNQRNNYRSTLIQYQRDRRTYYEFEDAIARLLRQNLREIELNKILFELLRRSVKVAVQGVENSRFKLEEPPRQVAGGGRSQLGATTARDLTGALDSLQRAQTSLLNVWVSFEVLRRNLDYELGTMQVTRDGFWLDPGKIDRSVADRAKCLDQLLDTGDPLPEELPDVSGLLQRMDQVPVDVPVEVIVDPTLGGPATE